MTAMLDDRQAALEGEIAELRRQLESCRAELTEAREQQTATAEVLQVINSSPGDLAPVFDAIVEKAHILCDAASGSLQLWDGEMFRGVAMRGFAEEMVELLRRGYSPGPNHPCRRLLEGERAAHCADLAEIDDPATREGGVKLGGIRTVLYVALRNDNALLGQIVAARQEVRPFSEKEIALVENFAAQAVIAMENARLMTETREALEQQTATAEVLQVINSSPGDLAPVFGAILEKAHSFCGADYGALLTYDGERFWPAAGYGASARMSETIREGIRPSVHNSFGELVNGAPLVHIHDMARLAELSPDDPLRRTVADIGGVRTQLMVPLRKDSSLLGVITANRKEVRPFTDKQIALLQNFAAQAVIAMENARLLTETREALEQQTATAEVLLVINSSPGDLAPVFDAILEKAHSLCGIAQGSLELYDGERFRAVAVRGLSDDFAEMLRQGYPAPDNPATQSLIEGGRFTHILDVAKTEYSITRSGAELDAARTLLCVPLRRDGVLLGMIASARREVRPFTEKQIALLENFAAQAVIAMENARLLTETREALEQQTATAEILRVISSSPADLQPTFDAIAGAAKALTGAALGCVATYDGRLMHLAALAGFTPSDIEKIQGVFPIPADHGTATGRAILTRQVAHVEDLAADPERAYPTLDRSSGQTVLAVPMLRDGIPIGAINVQRRTAEPFTDKQIDLIKTFADQAVIAMENARLITETREALEQQTATAEVLGVINSSPGDLTPVFDAMVERAARLCEADEAALRTFDGELLHLVALHGSEPDVVKRLRQLGPTRAFGLYEPFARDERVVHIADVRETDIFREDPVVRERLELRGIRTWLAVALHKEGALLGVINVHRHTIRPFTDKQIALLQNFAAQAVIAMENARLLTETREALEQQTATAEVLQVINSSPGDLAPVFETMLESAMRLCEAACGHLATFDGQLFHTQALQGDRRLVEWLRELGPFEPLPGSAAEQLVLGEHVVHILDAADDESYQAANPVLRKLRDLGGMRTLLGVALRKDDVLLGVIILYREEVRSFSDRQIALLQNFAAQAVIAMENARLLTETREALEQQTATAEVLQVINSSPGDLAPVFDAMLDKALRLCEAAYGNLLVFDGRLFSFASVQGEPDLVAHMRRREPFEPMPGTALSRIVEGEDVAEISDLLKSHEYNSVPQFRELVDIGGYRSLFEFALRKDKALLGVIAIFRREARAFTDKQIALLQNFAAQAVIAMENARLITETREALEQQTATAEVLQVINSSPGDLAPVFDAMLEKALELCGASFGTLWICEGEVFHAAALRRVPEAYAQFLAQGPVHPSRGSGAGLGKILDGGDFFHLLDAAAEPGYQGDNAGARALIELGGARTTAGVPLRKDGGLLGAITIYRQEVRPFSEKQIALLQNFAAQAVIAMENARLITETREALEQQTATAEVLQVINSSPGDLTPVFDALLEKAMQLCEATFGGLTSFDGERFHTLALRGLPAEAVEAFREPWIAGPGTYHENLVRGEPLVHTDFGVADPARRAHPQSRAIMEMGKARTGLIIALCRDERLLGSLFFYRQEIRPFSDKQIALLQNFAAQAVIAMENARLLTETREALEQQTATAEVLQVINSSPGDLAPVFDAILEKAHRLCGASLGSLQLYDGEEYRAVAIRGPLQAVAEQLRQPRRPGAKSPILQLTAGERFIQVPDAAEIDTPGMQNIVKLAGLRTVLYVALRKENNVLGFIGCGRDEVRLFTDKEIALLESFAAQAVIAMDNARLLDEIRQRQAELRVTFDNMGDGVAMFDAELRLAAWNRNFQEILDLPDELVGERPTFAEYFHYLAGRGEYASTDLEAELRGRLDDPDREMRFERTRPDGRVVEVRRNPVPGGGFVMIYSDITARKRAEEEIRTARDAAEKAYAELKTMQASLIHAEKMASLGQLTAGIAHEIKNPLNFVNNFAGLSVELLDELKVAAGPGIAALDPDTRAEIDETIQMLTGNLDKITEHGRRADGIVQSMLLHSRGGSGERQRVDLNALVDEALNLAYHGARAQDQDFNITLDRDFELAMPPVELVPQDMMRVFINLIGNGFHAARQRLKDADGSGFSPLLKVATRDLGDAVEIRVLDNGIGIRPEHRDKLFQPFFTTKPSGEGTGLGLSISYDIVAQQHGGSISVDSEPGVFTEFTVRLPRR